jgi:uncharacterized protein (TIGR03086 family)
MSEPSTPAERFRRVTGRFDEVVRAVPWDAWDAPTPCEGWVARDVVRHLVEWVPGVFGGAGLAFSSEPSVDEDPVRAWEQLRDVLQGALDDPDVAARTFDAGPPGEMTVEQAIDRLVTADVLVHTWDLASARGGDVELDPEVAADMLAGMEPMVDVLVASGHFGPPIAVAGDADVQTRLLALTGRDPGWTQRPSRLA